MRPHRHCRTGATQGVEPDVAYLDITGFHAPTGVSKGGVSSGTMREMGAMDVCVDKKFPTLECW